MKGRLCPFNTMYARFSIRDHRKDLASNRLDRVLKLRFSDQSVNGGIMYVPMLRSGCESKIRTVIVV